MCSHSQHTAAPLERVLIKSYNEQPHPSSRTFAVLCCTPCCCTSLLASEPPSQTTPKNAAATLQTLQKNGHPFVTPHHYVCGPTARMYSITASKCRDMTAQSCVTPHTLLTLYCAGSFPRAVMSSPTNQNATLKTCARGAGAACLW